MLPDPSSRLDRLPGYPLADVPEIRRRLRDEGVDVIDLGAGDADFPPPLQAVEALQRAAEDPDLSRYPFQLGLPAFREEVAAFMSRRFGVAVDPYREVLPLIGSKDGLAHLPFALLDPGDVAVIPDPAYQAYGGGTVLAGGEPWMVPLEPEHDFLLPLEAVPEGVVRRAKLLYLNYPNNPTAASAPESYLRDVVDFCRRHRIVLAYDNAYSELGYNDYRPPSVLQIEGAGEVSLEFHSLSKTYNMTGWRLGWAVGSAELIAMLSKVKTFMDTGAFLAVQAAGAAALEAHTEWIPRQIARFQSRRDAAVDALSRVGFDVRTPRATIYLWVPVPGAESSEAFARRALEEEGVVVLPGSSLGEGGEGFFRVALTVSEAGLEEAARRLGRVLR